MFSLPVRVHSWLKLTPEIGVNRGSTQMNEDRKLESRNLVEQQGPGLGAEESTAAEYGSSFLFNIPLTHIPLTSCCVF
jgi:hypothetical protein